MFTLFRFWVEKLPLIFFSCISTPGWNRWNLCWVSTSWFCTASLLQLFKLVNTWISLARIYFRRKLWLFWRLCCNRSTLLLWSCCLCLWFLNCGRWWLLHLVSFHCILASTWLQKCSRRRLGLSWRFLMISFFRNNLLLFSLSTSYGLLLLSRLELGRLLFRLCSLRSNSFCLLSLRLLRECTWLSRSSSFIILFNAWFIWLGDCI